MSNLQGILEHKIGEVERAKVAVSFDEIKAMAVDGPRVRPFKAALETAARDLALIAEIKKGSPSKGTIRADFDPRQVAEAYREAGAHCLSVLTDECFFQGSRENLETARSVSGLPCLRKDFIVDPYQVYEARAWGADCILLIVAAFQSLRSKVHSLECLWELGRELGMDILVEVHSRDEAEIALGIGADLIGVNNRDLSTLKTSLAVSDDLLPMVTLHAFAVSESALETHADLARVKAAGARAVLIGTTFCASPDIGVKVREVMGW